MSYGWFGLSGTRVRRGISPRLGSSVAGLRGGSSWLFSGMNDSSSRIMSRHSSSSPQAKWAQPERALWVMAPPRSSLVTSSWLTVLITSGPVMNMYEVSLTMNTKSVMAGE